MISKELFYSSVNEIGIVIPGETFDKFDKYASLLIDYNKKVNLTAITDPDAVTIKHFIDSLNLLKYVDISTGAKLCDVGTGAGFPGVCLALARPDIKVTLFDSINKKLDFIRFLQNELDFEAEIVTSRAEDAGKSAQFREKFGVVTARAVAALPKLSEYCVPLTEINGIFAPMKALLKEEEKNGGISAASKLGTKLTQDHIYDLPTGESREIIIFKKVSQTLPKYPRSAAMISKNPL
ncbi:MAG: 16S rRNA (guanine(527)-N(7))-methyltransferase RsmG [Clostridia bacterium]|nr:16S rRNA (guanine(527)-N(7))-methyltransferase RsmG [Clostridia bacterium]